MLVSVLIFYSIFDLLVFVLTTFALFISDSTMKRKVDGMISLGCFVLLLIVFVKCSLAVTVTELEVGPKITVIADEVKEVKEEKSTENE